VRACHGLRNRAVNSGCHGNDDVDVDDDDITPDMHSAPPLLLQVLAGLHRSFALRTSAPWKSVTAIGLG